MWKQLRMVWQARNWMKKNEPFLSTWQAYIGYKFDLFALMRTSISFEQLVDQSGLTNDLLRCWVDTGVVLGHLKQDNQGLFRASRKMQIYFSKQSQSNIGELLKEMLEMHIPALLHYPEMMQGAEKRYYVGDAYGQTVAATSALIEKRAFPYVHKIAKKLGVRSFLDVGCGQGGYLLELAERVGSGQGTFVGLDLNDDVIRLANSVAKASGLHHVTFACQPFEQFEAPEPFEMVMMNNLLHYYAKEQRLKLIQKATHHLRTDGYLVLVTPLYLERFGKRFATAFNSFMQAHSNLHGLPRKQELTEIANEVGLQLVRVKPIIREGSWYCLVFRKKESS